MMIIILWLSLVSCVKIEDNPSSPTYIQTVKGIGYRFSKDV